jgi:hypothetical protein
VSYGNCYTKLFENGNLNIGSAGSTYGPYASSSYVGGAMNDRTSSLQWF